MNNGPESKPVLARFSDWSEEGDDEDMRDESRYWSYLGSSFTNREKDIEVLLRVYLDGPGSQPGSTVPRQNDEPVLAVSPVYAEALKAVSE